MRRLAAALLALTLLATGCMPTPVITTASPVGQGTFQVGLEPALLGAASAESPPEVIPWGGVNVRQGLSETLEIGGRFGTNGFGIFSKVVLVNNDAMALSIAPAFGGMIADTSGAVFNMAAPVLIGFKIGDQSEFVISPTMSVLGFVGGSSNGTTNGGLVVLGGSSFTLATQVTRNLWLMPELSLHYPVAGAASFDGSNNSFLDLGAGAFVFMATFGVIWEPSR